MPTYALPPSRIVNGKMYHPVAIDGTKREADSRAKRLRKEKYLTRVTKEQDVGRAVYIVWVHDTGYMTISGIRVSQEKGCGCQ